MANLFTKAANSQPKKGGPRAGDASDRSIPKGTPRDMAKHPSVRNMDSRGTEPINKPMGKN